MWFCGTSGTNIADPEILSIDYSITEPFVVAESNLRDAKSSFADTYGRQKRKLMVVFIDICCLDCKWSGGALHWYDNNSKKYLFVLII